MSFTAFKNAMQNISMASVSPCAKLVFVGLSNRHNQETGRCDPSVETIAGDLGISERSVRNGLRELEKNGLITTTHRTRRTGRGKRNLSNRYNLKGGAESAGGVGQILPPKQEYTPSAFDDLAMLVEDSRNE
jgi:DNA-binding transcriptional ArsR family regulator